VIFFFLLFFSGNLAYGIVRGQMIIKGGVNSPTPFIHIIDRDEQWLTFWVIFLFYSIIVTLLIGMGVEELGLIDVPYLKPISR